jgi:chromosome segregation protein
MKIKRLAIHGFKSFVDKVTFDFPMGTSAVVGPNGCGKSNIVDAIRWVLGEQNARHLRGKLMEDVIFNGSDAKKPLGMAEVSLTFSNEGGAASPRFAAFAEIEVSRRIYRSGESEYNINKVPSRLRDIVDLFTDTGIGTRAYSIIEQGQAAHLINARPEERRAVFEEAAGINKYKHRKEAALRRLEAARENLTRVLDIISEVRRQLNSLNRQAKKAERYKVLRDELKDVDILISSAEFKRLSDAFADAEKRLAEACAQESALSGGVAAKEAETEGFKADHLSAEEGFREIRERVYGLEKEIQDAERLSALAGMRIEELKRAEERLKAEIDELNASQGRAVAERTALAEAHEKAEEAVGLATGRLVAEESGLNAVTATLKEKEAALRASSGESLKAASTLSDIRHSIQALLREEESLRYREAKSASGARETAEALDSKRAMAGPMRDDLERVDGERRGAAGRMERASAAIESMEMERAEKAASLKALEAEHANARARIETLDEMERGFESLRDGARSVMIQGGEGVHGIIADVIEANPGYEKAVEAALGARIQGVIVEGQERGVEAVDRLKATRGGRASFVPLREVRDAAAPLPVNAGAGYAGGGARLLSEVAVKGGYEEMVGALLGSTVVVEDIGAALDLWRRGGVYATIVTLGGEVIDAQGVITGGASSRADDGILEKRAEAKRLKSLAAALGERTARMAEGLRETEAALSDERGSLDRCREELHAADMERVNIESGLRMIEEETSRLAASMEALSSEGAEAAARLAEIALRKTGLSSERDAVEKGVAELERRSAALAVEAAGEADKRDAASRLVTEIRVALAEESSRRDSLRRQADEKEAAISASLGRVEAKAVDLEAGKAEMEAKLGEVEGLKAGIESLLARRDALKGEESEASSGLAVLAGRIREAEAEIKGLKTALADRQGLKGALSIRLKETGIELANLKERVRERYSVDIEGVPLAGEGPVDLDDLGARRNDLRERIDALGEVSLSALEEYAELEKRLNFLIEQQEDLARSAESLHAAITRINRTTRERFRAAFDEINAKFKETFPRFFKDGRAELRLTDDGDILEAGVEIVAQPPGKRLQSITLLSGGEKAMTATALIFAIFLVKPSPFCLLDEVDSPLDDANIDRFNLFVKDLSRHSQFIIITHNKKSMEMADALYGVTMEEPGVSKTIAVRF